MTKPTIVISAALLLMSCTPESHQNTVSGNIDNAEGQTVGLVGYTRGQPDTLDTDTLTATGEYSLAVPKARVNFYTLFVGPENSVVLLLDSTDKDVTVNADLNTIDKTYEVSGSPDSKDLRDLFVKETYYLSGLDSLMEGMQASATAGDTEGRTALSSKYNALHKEYTQYLKSFIDEDSTRLANYTAIQRLDPRKDFEYILRVRNGLAGQMTGNFFFDRFAEEVARMQERQRVEQLLAPGSVVPDIVLPNPEGDVLKLSNYRGKYVLIDFWASWCVPCRRENPNVVAMYNKYASKGFEIFGVSLDRDRGKWIQAIADDHLEWPQVSDLKFWNSAAAKLYNVTAIPYTVLIDPEGRVVETRLRGAQLETKLRQIFGA